MYQPGNDVARSMFLLDDNSGYVLDAYGGLHPFGGAPEVFSGFWQPSSQVRVGAMSIEIVLEDSEFLFQISRCPE